VEPTAYVRGTDSRAAGLQCGEHHLHRHQARLGALGGRFEHYAPWKTIDGSTLAPAGLPELEVLVRGVFPPATFLDLVRNYVAFSDERSGLVKRVAKYHQFYAVNRAVAGTVAAMGRGDGRAGVVWHTQGSGKSLEMLFYVGKIMREPAMANPTAVLLTDRNDLDDQLFDEVFAPSRTLPETPIQATSREHVRQLLASKASGGIVFSTMQKFGLTRRTGTLAAASRCCPTGRTSSSLPTRPTVPSTT
jgi:type I restriction enzyme, R subunit